MQDMLNISKIFLKILSTDVYFALLACLLKIIAGRAENLSLEIFLKESGKWDQERVVQVVSPHHA